VSERDRKEGELGERGSGKESGKRQKREEGLSLKI